MKTFEEVYQAWINESIAEAKKNNRKLQKKNHSPQQQYATSPEGKNYATIGHNLVNNLRSKLRIRLTT